MSALEFENVVMSAGELRCMRWRYVLVVSTVVVQLGCTLFRLLLVVCSEALWWNSGLFDRLTL